MKLHHEQKQQTTSNFCYGISMINQIVCKLLIQSQNGLRVLRSLYFKRW